MNNKYKDLNSERIWKAWEAITNLCWDITRFLKNRYYFRDWTVEERNKENLEEIISKSKRMFNDKQVIFLSLYLKDFVKRLDKCIWENSETFFNEINELMIILDLSFSWRISKLPKSLTSFMRNTKLDNEKWEVLRVLSTSISFYFNFFVNASWIWKKENEFTKSVFQDKNKDWKFIIDVSNKTTQKIAIYKQMFIISLFNEIKVQEKNWEKFILFTLEDSNKKTVWSIHFNKRFFNYVFQNTNSEFIETRNAIVKKLSMTWADALKKMIFINDFLWENNTRFVEKDWKKITRV